MGWIIGIVAVVVVVALIVWFAVARHPEDAATHQPETKVTPNERFYAGVDRPAGPGAEAEGVAGPGQAVPGPLPEEPAPPRDVPR